MTASPGRSVVTDEPVKAARLHDYGDERLQLDEVPDPQIQGPHDVVTRIGGAGVCRTDLHVMDGIWRGIQDPSLPFTLGHENAGWVEEVRASLRLGAVPGDSCLPLPGRRETDGVWCDGFTCLARAVAPRAPIQDARRDADKCCRRSMRSQCLTAGKGVLVGALPTRWRTDLVQGGSEADGPGGRSLSRVLVGRAAAVLFWLCGVSGFAGLVWPPLSDGQPSASSVAVAAAVAAGAGLVSWFLPWNRWPRWTMLLLVPVGLTVVALQIALAGAAAGVSAALFILLFAWIGIALPRGTALLALPLFAVAYLLPLIFVGRFSWLAVAMAVYVGLACLVIGELLAWLSSRLQLSQAAVSRAGAVDDLGAELVPSADPDKLWPSIALRLSAAAGLPDCDIYRLTEGGLICLGSVYDGAPCPDYLGLRPEQDVWAVDGKAVLAKEPVLIASPADPRLAPAEREDMRKWREQAMLIVPLVAGDEVLGLVEISEIREGRTITAEQTATVVSACRLIAVALHNADLARATEESERRLSSLHESSRAVAGAASLEEALAVITRCAGEALGVSECAAYEHEPELDAIVMRARWERAPGGHDRPAEPRPLAEDPTGRGVLESGRSLLERLSDPALDPAVLADLDGWGHKSRLTVAMPSADGSVGLLTFGDAERERVFPGEDLAVASALAGLAGDAVAGARLLRRLASLSEADAMTGLASHRELHESLAMEQARAEDHDSHFAAVMLGLDGLKSLNDTYGHPAGDEVLRQVASMLSERTGTRDVVGRWTGDKFLLILAETTAAQASLLAEELLAALAETPYVTASGEQVPIRVSFGIAAYPEDAPDASGLVAAADADLAASGAAAGEVVAGDQRDGLHRDAGIEAAAAPLAADGTLQETERRARAAESSAGPADEPAAPARPAGRDDGAIDQAEMRSRIEATRTRLKVKAFDAMIRGGTALLSQDGGEAPEPTDDDPGLDGDLEGMVDGAFSEQEY